MTNVCFPRLAAARRPKIDVARERHKKDQEHGGFTQELAKLQCKHSSLRHESVQHVEGGLLDPGLTLNNHRHHLTVKNAGASPYTAVQHTCTTISQHRQSETPSLGVPAPPPPEVSESNLPPSAQGRACLPRVLIQQSDTYIAEHQDVPQHSYQRVPHSTTFPTTSKLMYKLHSSPPPPSVTPQLSPVH